MAVGVKSLDDLSALIVLEQFKYIVPDRIATYINEHKVKTAAEAEVLADEFVLPHKNLYSDHHFRSRRHDQHTGNQFVNSAKFPSGVPGSFVSFSKSENGSQGRVELNSTCN